MIKENTFIYEAIMSESSSLKFHLELLRLILSNCFFKFPRQISIKRICKLFIVS